MYQGTQNKGKPITQHHLDHQIQVLTNVAFTIVGYQGQVICFIVLIHVSTPIMIFQTSNTTTSSWKTPPHARSTVY